MWIRLSTPADLVICAGEYFVAVLFDDAGNQEVVHIVGIDSEDPCIIHIERGKEGTKQLSFPREASIEIRLTAGTLQRLSDALLTLEKTL